MKKITIGAVVLVLALACTYSFAANSPPFIGVNYGPYHKDGQSPDIQTAIPDSQFLADLAIITPKFKYIRIYGVEKAGRLDRLVPLIAQHYPNLKVYLGIFESSKYRNETVTQMNTAIELANAYPAIVQGVIVGNECLDRDFAAGAVTVNQLRADLQNVRSRIPNHDIFVTTCFGFYSALNPKTLPNGQPDPRYLAGKDYGTQLMPDCDVMMFTVYPFFGGYDISEGLSNTQYWYNYAKNLFNGKQVFLGEAGWPSAALPGSAPNAIPSVANEQKYITDLIVNQQNQTTQLGPIFLFEAFDEPWKKGNQWETHWGLWDKFGTPKFDFTVPTLPQSGTPPIEAKIDINPDDPNYIDIDHGGLVPVALLSSNSFDPQTVDLDTVRFGELGAEAKVSHSFSTYANSDRKRDLILYFQVRETGLQRGDTIAYLTGLTKSGSSIVGSDSIITIGNFRRPGFFSRPDNRR